LKILDLPFPKKEMETCKWPN